MFYSGAAIFFHRVQQFSSTEENKDKSRINLTKHYSPLILEKLSKEIEWSTPLDRRRNQHLVIQADRKGGLSYQLHVRVPQQTPGNG